MHCDFHGHVDIWLDSRGDQRQLFLLAVLPHSEMLPKNCLSNSQVPRLGSILIRMRERIIRQTENIYTSDDHRAENLAMLNFYRLYLVDNS